VHFCLLHSVLYFLLYCINLIIICIAINRLGTVLGGIYYSFKLNHPHRKSAQLVSLADGLVFQKTPWSCRQTIVGWLSLCFCRESCRRNWPLGIYLFLVLWTSAMVLTLCKIIFHKAGFNQLPQVFIAVQWWHGLLLKKHSWSGHIFFLFPCPHNICTKFFVMCVQSVDRVTFSHKPRISFVGSSIQMRLVGGFLQFCLSANVLW